MDNAHTPILVGSNCIVVRDNAILLGLRRGAGEGKWGIPGGHLEPGERVVDAALRELKEETGLEAPRADFVAVVNDVRTNSEGNMVHRIHFVFEVAGILGEPENKEPDKCSEWRWFPKDELPENIWSPFADMMRAYLERHTLLDAPRLP